MRFFIGILICLFTSIAGASTSTGAVNILVVNRYDHVLIQLTDNDSYAPCAEVFKRYVTDLSTESGKAMYSLMMSAQAQGKSLKIAGTGTCDIRGDSETIQYIQILN